MERNNDKAGEKESFGIVGYCRFVCPWLAGEHFKQPSSEVYLKFHFNFSLYLQMRELKENKNQQFYIYRMFRNQVTLRLLKNTRI